MQDGETTKHKRETIVALILVAIFSYFIGKTEGAVAICDMVGGALQDSGRIRAIVDGEFGEQYLREIEKACNW